MLKRSIEVLVFTLAYGVVAYATLGLARSMDVPAAMWPAGALALGVLLLLRRKAIAPEAAGLTAMSAAVHLALGDGVGPSAILGVANGLDLIIPFGMFGIAGIARDQPGRVRIVTGLFLIALTSAIPGAVLGGLALAAARGGPPASACASWWLLQSFSLLILTPPFLFWRSLAERKALSFSRDLSVAAERAARRRLLLEILAAAVTLTAAALVVLVSGRPELIELSATVLLWFALRFGVFTTAVTIAIYTICVLSLASLGIWPIPGGDDPAAVMATFQVTLALTALPVLLVAGFTSQRERARRELDQNARRLTFALEGANDGLWDWHMPSGEVFFSVRCHRMLGLDPDPVSPEPFDWRGLMHPDDRARIEQALDDHMSGRTPFYEAEFRYRHKDGHWVWILDRGKVVERDASGAPVRAVGTQTDISQRKELERALEHLATHDTLTGLANRSVFERGLVQAAGRLDRRGGSVAAVILIDLDHFKAVNDTHGHAAGDLLLETTAARLRGAARVDDLVARFGGDEFAVIATGQSATEFDALAERLCRVLSEPVAGDTFEIRPSVSIGIAVANAPAQVGGDLVVRADRALYAVKNAGRGSWRSFDDAERVA